MKNWGHLFSNILSNIFDKLFSTRCFELKILMCFQWIFDWSVSLIAKWREHYMLTFAGDISQDIIVIGKVNCESSVWSILMKHSSGSNWLVTCYVLDDDPASLTVMLLWNQLWRKRGQWFWIRMFDEFLCCEVNPSGFETTRIFWKLKFYIECWWLQWLPRSQNVRWSSIAWLQVCTSKDVAGIEKVLDTKGYISCSRMLKSRHGCLDQGFNPLKEMGLPGFWAKFEWWCHLSCCYLVWILSQCKWSFISWVAKAKLKSTRMTCCFAYANHPGCCEVTCWSDWKWNISLLILLKSSLCGLVNVWNKLVVCGKLKRMNSCFYQNILLLLLLKTDPTYELDQNKADLFPWVDLSSLYGLCCLDTMIFVLFSDSKS